MSRMVGWMDEPLLYVKMGKVTFITIYVYSFPVRLSVLYYHEALCNRTSPGQVPWSRVLIM